MKLTEAQKALIATADANGNITVAKQGQKVTARKLMRMGILKLTGPGIYTIA